MQLCNNRSKSIYPDAHVHVRIHTICLGTSVCFRNPPENEQFRIESNSEALIRYMHSVALGIICNAPSKCSVFLRPIQPDHKFIRTLMSSKSFLSLSTSCDTNSGANWLLHPKSESENHKCSIQCIRQ